MADEAEVTSVLRFFKDGDGDDFARIRQLISVAGKKFHKIRQTIATTETALNMGGITSPGLLAIANMDPTNAVHLWPGSGLTSTLSYLAGEGYVSRLKSTFTAPYMIADNAAVDIVGLVIEA